MGLAEQRERAARFAEAQQGRLTPLPIGSTGAPPMSPVARALLLGVLVVMLVACLLTVPVVLFLLPVIDTEDDRQIGTASRAWVAAAVAVLLVLAYVPARRRWLLERTPTVPVGAALSGTCETIGTVAAIEPTTSWFTGLRCVWWQASMFVGTGKHMRQVWEANGGTDRCTLVGDDGNRITVVLQGPKHWHRRLTSVSSGRAYGDEDGLVEGDRLLVLGDVAVVGGERVLTAKRATQRTETAERSGLRWSSRIAVAAAALGAAYLAAVTVDDEVLVFRASPGSWAAAGAATLLVAAFVIGWIGNRRANPELAVGSPFS